MLFLGWPYPKNESVIIIFVIIIVKTDVMLYLRNRKHFPCFYLTIRLRARDFYEVIVDEGEARINYHFIEIESE